MKTFFALFAVIVLFSSCSPLDRTATIYYNESEISIDDITAMREAFEDPAQ
jgi:hypothetical protein